MVGLHKHERIFDEQYETLYQQVLLDHNKTHETLMALSIQPICTRNQSIMW